MMLVRGLLGLGLGLKATIFGLDLELGSFDLDLQLERNHCLC